MKFWLIANLDSLDSPLVFIPFLLLLPRCSGESRDGVGTSVWAGQADTFQINYKNKNMNLRKIVLRLVCLGIHISC